jgi:putative ABC transport system permease protein
VMDLPEQPTNAMADDINAELFESVGDQAWFTFKHPGPPTEQILWAISGIAALVALTSAAVTAGLALADGRSDHMTLAGVGAAPALRKRLAAAQTALGASLGVVLGMVGGLVPAVAVLIAVQRYQLVIPWPQLIALVALVPLIGAGAAWLFTRARLPMTRRALLQ